MEIKDIWNDLCYRIQRKNYNHPEREFQIIAENLFEKLGWLQYKGEIITQKAIPVGASKTVKPDIVISGSGKNLFVIELKKPNISISERNSGQLFSYMRLLKLNFGILLGETLQAYYEVSNDDESPRKIVEIQFNLDSEEGINFIKLLSKNEYSPDNIENYCKRKIEFEAENEKAQQYIADLCSEKGTRIVTNLLKEKLSENFSEDVIVSIINAIKINISRIANGIPIPQPGNGDSKEPKDNIIINKPQAMALVNEKHGLNLNDSNTMYSTINQNVEQWSFNRKNFHFNDDTHMILINQNTRELHYFFIKGGTITDPSKTFDQRNDERVKNCSIIRIPVLAFNFKEENSNFPFGNYKVDTIQF